MQRIIVIEDNEDLAHLIRFKLSKLGYEIDWQPDGESGLEAVRSAKPDLVLLDIMLPKMDGFEVLSILKDGEDTKDIPVILVTALAAEREVAHGFELGATDYIVKPLRIEELGIRVQRALAGRG